MCYKKIILFRKLTEGAQGSTFSKPRNLGLVSHLAISACMTEKDVADFLYQIPQ